MVNMTAALVFIRPVDFVEGADFLEPGHQHLTCQRIKKR